MSQILTVLHDQSQSSWASDWEFVSYYNFSGMPGSLSPAVSNGGNGEPKKANGLVGSSHRPSDDLCIFSMFSAMPELLLREEESSYALGFSANPSRPDFITSDNAMMSVELGHTADMLDKIGTLQNMTSKLHEHEGVIRQAVWDHTRSQDGIFAYETNGYGAQYFMDDANMPSLVSLPYLGFVPRNNSAYVKTKEAMFSRANPYYAVGKNFSGIG